MKMLIATLGFVAGLSATAQAERVTKECIPAKVVDECVCDPGFELLSGGAIAGGTKAIRHSTPVLPNTWLAGCIDTKVNQPRACDNIWILCER